MQIKDLAIGDGGVFLMEGGSKVKFYALCHNYESGLNGKGRTMFCRESPATSGIHTTSKRNSYSVDANSEATWCKNTYANKFSDEVQNWIGTTKYVGQYASMSINGLGTQTGTVLGSGTYESSFFPISAAELGASNRSDGSALSSAAISRISSIQTRYGNGIWTRSPSTTLTDKYNTIVGNGLTGVAYCYANSLYISSASGSDIVTGEGTYGSSYGYLPCFTLPETLYIDKDGFATENQPPEVTSAAGESGTDLGEKNAPFDFNSTVTDADGDTLTVTEKLDGKTTATRTGIASGTALTFGQGSTAENFQRILNGSHTIQITANDGKESTSLNATFTKSVTSASVTLTTPLAVDGDITVAVLQVTGSIPDDAVFKAEVTNNANDPSPVWQDATTEVQKGVNIVFTNSTAANGAAFNFRVSISRGASGTGGYIEAVSGAFH